MTPRTVVWIMAFACVAIVAALAVMADERSSRWPTVRNEQVRLYPWCAVCGETERLQVHHIAPFGKHPELELVATNLIVLCDGVTIMGFTKRSVGCHYKIGHIRDWKRNNGLIEQQFGRGSNSVGFALWTARKARGK